MIPVRAKDVLSENSSSRNDVEFTRRTLGKFQRAKVLEIYFARLDGRVPDDIPVELEDLYQIDLNDMKAFLLGQYPQDNLLLRLFKVMH